MPRSGDRELGMDRSITRRDLFHGAAALTVGLLAGGGARPAGAQEPTPVGGPAGAPAAAPSSGPAGTSTAYPPQLTGLRGSHRGSFEVAHAVALDGKTDWGPVLDTGEPTYDLVVVGAGVSGLAAAWFYRKAAPDARILLLDNHDDFGGHAKRNEFEVAGRTLLGHGGSQTIEAPSRYSKVAKGLLADLGIDLERFTTAYDQSFFQRHGLAGAIYFDADSFGQDRVVRHHSPSLQAWIPVDGAVPPTADAVASFPIDEEARRQIGSLYSGEAGKRFPQWRSWKLVELSYPELLARVGVDHPQALKYFDGMPAPLACVGIDAIPAAYAAYFGLPSPDGPQAADLGEPYIHHFPDGNASVARLLVRRLIPSAVPGATMEDVVTARARYNRLDVDGEPARLRLDSTVVRVAHDGAPSTAREVDVVYVRGGRAERVRARRCVMACYNMVIPFLCPDVPPAQRDALRKLVKSPLVYTNVALANWRAFQKLGIGAVYSPGRWHHYAYLDFPVSLGDYAFSAGPDQPIVVHMDWEPRSPGQPAHDQHREGRRALLRTSFEEIEREVRTHLAGMLGAGGFDPAADIAALTVNRWAHGYAPSPTDYPNGERPHLVGRKPIGRITIANSDAGARAYLDCAIDEAWRAVNELPS
jgi:spermidine dehydrogenase